MQQLCKQTLGKRISPSALYRWLHADHVSGNLQATKIGNSWFTTADAFADFLQKRGKPSSNSLSPSQPSDEELEAFGLLGDTPT